jgi:hypothetical protein
MADGYLPSPAWSRIIPAMTVTIPPEPSAIGHLPSAIRQ